MAKKAKKRPPRRAVRRRSSRVEQQKRYRTIVIGTAISVAVVIVGVLVYGLVIDRLIKARAVVANVNGVTITAGDLRGEIDFLQRLYMMPLSAEYVDFVLDDIVIREELVRQEAARRGLVVMDEDVQRKIEEELGYYRDGTPTPIPTLPATATPVPTTVVTATESLTPTPTLAPVPTPTPVTAEGFKQSYDEFLAMRNISDAEYREYVVEQLLYQALLKDFVKDVPSALEQVQLRYLRVMDEGLASELARRLEDEVAFDVLKEEIESKEEAPGYGSALRWFTKETLEQELVIDMVEPAFSMDSGVFIHETQGMYYAVEVVDRRVRDVEDSLADQLANMALGEWIEAQQELVEHFDFDPEYVLVDPPAGVGDQLMSP